MSMLDEGIEVPMVGGIDDVEEVLPVWHVGRGLLLGKKLGQLGLGHDVLDEVDHAELLIPRDVDRSKLNSRDQVLPTCEHLLEKVLGDFLDGWKVVLA